MQPRWLCCINTQSLLNFLFYHFLRFLSENYNTSPKCLFILSPHVVRLYAESQFRNLHKLFSVSFVEVTLRLLINVHRHYSQQHCVILLLWALLYCQNQKLREKGLHQMKFLAKIKQLPKQSRSNSQRYVICHHWEAIKLQVMSTLFCFWAKPIYVISEWKHSYYKILK